jgi:hypothetical protein
VKAPEITNGLTNHRMFLRVNLRPELYVVWGYIFQLAWVLPSGDEEAPQKRLSFFRRLSWICFLPFRRLLLDRPSVKCLSLVCFRRLLLDLPSVVFSGISLGGYPLALAFVT